MTKLSQQKKIDVAGGKIFANSLDESYFQICAIDGNYEDIDGQIRLIDGKDNYLDKFLHYQLKSTSSLRNQKYSCKRKVIDFLVSSNVPTLLFVVDISTKKVYWFFFDENNKRKYEINKDNKQRTLELTGLEVNRINASELCNRWAKFAHPNSYREISESMSKIVSEFESNSIKCIGLLYLLKVVRKDEVAEFFNQILNISKPEVELILSRFAQENVISETKNLYVIENDQIGIEALKELIADVSISKLYELVKDKERRQNLLDQISNLTEKSSQSYLKQYGNNLYKSIKNSKTNDEVFDHLAYLEKISYRIPDITFKIANQIRTSEPKISKKIKLSWIRYEGITYEKVILKMVDILENIRYYCPIKYLDFISKLSLIEIFHERSIDAIKKLGEFNYEALRKVGYRFQILILNEIESWGIRKKLKYEHAILGICEKLLNSEFEGISMVDYKTVSFQFGPLHPSGQIADIRQRSINLLFLIFNARKQIEIRMNIVQVLKNASKLPSRGNYSSDLEEIIVENIKCILQFYIDNFAAIDEELICEIEGELYWLSRRYDIDQITKIKELGDMISNNEEYQTFKTFYGFDFLHDVSDWNQEREQRLESINRFVKEISEDNWGEWEKRIISLGNRYSSDNAGKFSYFYHFLKILGEEKPKFAFSLFSKRIEQLNHFYIYLLTGIVNSNQREEGEILLLDLIKNQKYYELASNLYNQPVDFNFDIFNKIVEKIIKSKNVNQLHNLLNVCIENYSKNKSLKNTFLSIIKELQRIGDSTWGSNLFWIKDYSIFESFSSGQMNIILNSLIPVERISYPLEELLNKIFSQYPEKISQFFLKRIEFHLDNMDDFLYDPIPYKFVDFQKIIKSNETALVPDIVKWFSKDNRIYHLYGSNLLKQIFPNFDSEFLIQQLEEMIDEGGDKNAKMILAILHSWEGGISIHEVCKSFIKKFLNNPTDKNYKNYKTELMILLSQTGVVSGEYGFSEALKVKKKEMQEWKKDEDETLNLFIKDYETDLDKRIQIYRDQADEDIILMKRGIR